MKPRVLNDFYPTPQGITELLLDYVTLCNPIIEPCAGHNAITKVLEDSNYVVHPYDLTWFDTGGFSTSDATQELFWSERKKAHAIYWTVTNPPFSLAEKIIPLAYEYSEVGIAMLLRLSYLEPTKGRADWLKEHADNLYKVIPVNPRVRFRADTKGTDSITCAWFCWSKYHSWHKLGLSSPFSFVTDWNS